MFRNNRYLSALILSYVYSKDLFVTTSHLSDILLRYGLPSLYFDRKCIVGQFLVKYFQQIWLISLLLVVAHNPLKFKIDVKVFVLYQILTSFKPSLKYTLPKIN